VSSLPPPRPVLKPYRSRNKGARYKPFIIGPLKRVLTTEAREVDVITDQHDISNLELGIKPSSCIGDHQGIHTQKPEYPYWECHLRNKRLEKFFSVLTAWLKWYSAYLASMKT
jgi:hypothetical protein